MSNVFDDAVDAVASQWRKANGGGFLTTAEKNELISILRDYGDTPLY
jgi:hypothetical protein